MVSQTNLSTIVHPPSIAGEKRSTILKLKAKQSFRKIFSTKGVTRTDQPASSGDQTKRSSMVSAGKTLVKRVSKTLSRTNPPRDAVTPYANVPPVPEVETATSQGEETGTLPEDDNITELLAMRDARISSIEASIVAEGQRAQQDPTMTLDPETTTIVSNMAELSCRMSTSSPATAREILRGLDIANACIRLSTLTQDARTAATRAEASAEQARLDAHAAEELGESVKKASDEHLGMLEQGFEDEELRGYMQHLATNPMLFQKAQTLKCATTEQ
jgi:hypothetical protein